MFLNKNVVDYMNFRAICRSCESAAPLIQWREAPISLKSAPLLPWLMSPDNHSGIHSFVDPKLGGKYLVKVPESLVDANILYSRKGWLLMHSISRNALSFYNPFTKDIIKLPYLLRAFVLSSSMGFTYAPTSKSYVVVAIHITLHEAEVRVFWYGWRGWSNYRFTNDISKFVSNHNSPVFHEGGFYVLGKDGNLGVFKVLWPERYTWKVLAVPQKPCISFCQSFLLECGGRLLSVFMGPVGEWIKVFALNGITMRWDKVSRLEHNTLYLNRPSSFSKPGWITGMGEKSSFQGSTMIQILWSIIVWRLENIIALVARMMQ
ncbi:F-box/kelch-repeat protein At1g57790-like [Tripterygium wilfordii]|uniref:F-box/kelch-repeat protein At1g57790-like n=1 Tax=Tripterygium wilfordii TaxID=458696 RepID=UPI0018F7F87A|nr:F-box/kelch-repeat protein At1g57790-like [Tripterygium wilfordii]